MDNPPQNNHPSSQARHPGEIASLRPVGRPLTYGAVGRCLVEARQREIADRPLRIAAPGKGSIQDVMLGSP